MAEDREAARHAAIQDLRAWELGEPQTPSAYFFFGALAFDFRFVCERSLAATLLAAFVALGSFKTFEAFFATRLLVAMGPSNVKESQST